MSELRQDPPPASRKSGKFTLFISLLLAARREFLDYLLRESQA